MRRVNCRAIFETNERADLQLLPANPWEPSIRMKAKGSMCSSGTHVGATASPSSNLNLWFKPNLEFGEILNRRFRSQQTLQILQQVFLARLTERKPVDRQTVLEPFQPADFAAERQQRNTTLDP